MESIAWQSARPPVERFPSTKPKTRMVRGHGNHWIMVYWMAYWACKLRRSKIQNAKKRSGELKGFDVFLRAQAAPIQTWSPHLRCAQGIEFQDPWPLQRIPSVLERLRCNSIEFWRATHLPWYSTRPGRQHCGMHCCESGWGAAAVPEQHYFDHNQAKMCKCCKVYIGDTLKPAK